MELIHCGHVHLEWFKCNPNAVYHVPRAIMYYCMYVILASLYNDNKLKMSSHKQTIRCLGHMLKMTLVFANVGVVKKP